MLSCAGVSRSHRVFITRGRNYAWSKEFLEAGKKRLAGDTTREATSSEVTVLRHEMGDLKEALAETLMENRLLKKSMLGDGGKHG